MCTVYCSIAGLETTFYLVCVLAGHLIALLISGITIDQALRILTEAMKDGDALNLVKDAGPLHHQGDEQTHGEALLI